MAIDTTTSSGRARTPRPLRAPLILLGLVVVLALSACGTGTWAVAPTPSPIRAIHAALLKNGHVLLIQGSGNDPATFAAGTFSTVEWDPVANTFQSIPTPSDMFCSGHAALPDGNLLVAGGTNAYPDATQNSTYSGSKHAYRFDVDTHQYVAVPDLAEGHWYPTLVSRGDGSVIAVAGVDEHRELQSDYQVFDPTANNGVGDWSAQATTAEFFPTYPALHLLSDGRFLFSGVTTFGLGGEPPGIWDATANTFTPVPGLTDVDRRDMGASVLLPPAQDQRVMVMGGGQHNNDQAVATASTAVVDMKQPSPSFVPGPPMSESKQYVSAVTLPDRTVLQSGGSNETYLVNDRADFAFRYSAQIFHPDTMTWETAANSTVGRTYHSEALLLPDGRVATFGGNASNTKSGFEMRIELFTPRYVTKVRPVLTVDDASRTITRGGTTSFASDQPLKWVELVRPGSATHSNDPDQRLVDLPFTQTDTAVTASLDSNPDLTPPGWYMLFGVDAANTPSVATWVQVT